MWMNRVNIQKFYMRTILFNDCLLLAIVCQSTVSLTGETLTATGISNVKNN